MVRVEGGGRVTSNLTLLEGEIVLVDLEGGVSLGRVAAISGNQMNT